jgi:hypothetical protein
MLVRRGRPGPHPGGSKAVRRSAIIAAVHTGAQHRQSNSKSFSLRMTGKMTGKCRTAGDSAKCFQHFSTLATVGKKKKFCSLSGILRLLVLRAVRFRVEQR